MGTLPTGKDRPLVRLNVDLGEIDLGSSRANVIYSPDGTRIAYVATPIAGGPLQLYTRRLDQEVAVTLLELTGENGLGNPFFSPDGEWIGFGDSQSRQLKKISVQGGAAVSLAPLAQGLFSGGSWGEDGYIVYGVALTDGLRRVPEGGGESESIVALSRGQVAYNSPQVLPGGKAVLFTSDAAQDSIGVVSMDGSERKTIVPGASAGRYLPSGHLIYVVEGTLFAVPFDAERLETRGPAVPILEGVGTNAVGQASLAFSRNGTLVYRPGAAPGTTVISTVEWLDAAGKRETIISAPDAYRQPQISPDQRRVVLSIATGPSSDRLSVYDTARGGFSPLTFDNAANTFPVWSPDGRFVVFSKAGVLMWARADGAGQPQPLLKVNDTVPTRRAATSFSPDGKRLAYRQQGDLFDLWTVPVSVEGETMEAGDPELFLATPSSEQLPMFSPDGRWIAYISQESGRQEVYVRAFPPPASGEGPKFPVSTGGGRDPVWSRNSDELFFGTLFNSPDGNSIMVAKYRVNGDNFVAERPRVSHDLTGVAFSGSMGSDGRALVTVPVRTGEPDAASEAPHTVVFLQNFFDELRRRVPVEGN